jgi:hypothetical protein
MYERILKQMREKIRTKKYVMTLHAEEEMTDDNLSIFDIEKIILTGSIVEKQKDKNTSEWKYLIEGKIISNKWAKVVAKLSIAGKLVFITAYKL